MNTKAPPAAKVPWAWGYLSFKKKKCTCKKVRNTKNTTIDLETKVPQPLEGCCLVSFVKSVLKTSIRHLVERSWIISSIRNEVFKIP